MSTEGPGAPAPSSRRQPRRGGRVVQFLLPPPTSSRHAIGTLISGFAVEGGTELYQFLSRDDLVQGPIAYYGTLATTVLGFYLMFLGLREWHAFHPRSRRERATPGKRALPWFALGLWAGGTVMTAIVWLALGSTFTGTTPFWIGWPVGGMVVLAFGNFFFGLRREADLAGSTWGVGLGWAAFLWSLGVAVIAGVVVGDRAFLLLTEFVTNWGNLITSIGPIVVAMSPLFVSYALLIAVFGFAVRPASPRGQGTSLPNEPV